MMMKKKGFKKGGKTDTKKKIKAQASALKGEGRMKFPKTGKTEAEDRGFRGPYSGFGNRQQQMVMEPTKTKKKKSPMKRKPTSTAEAQDTRSRLRGTTGGGKADVNPAYKKGGKLMKKKGMAKGGMMKKGYAMGGALKGSQSKLDKNKDGKISGDDFKMMKKKGGGMMKKKGMAKGGMMKKGMKKGGKVRGSGIARQGVRAAIMV